MIHRILPFLFLAVALASVPQYLDLESLKGEEGNAAERKPVVYRKNSNQPHYVSGKREVVIRADRTGHYQSSFRANGRHINGLIDTGATYVAINESLAKSLGIRLTASDFKHNAQTANGTTKAAFSTIERLEIGAISVENVETFVLKDKALSSPLIGMSFISKLASFRVENSELILTQ